MPFVMTPLLLAAFLFSPARASAQSLDAIGDLIGTIETANGLCTQAKSRDCPPPASAKAAPAAPVVANGGAGAAPAVSAPFGRSTLTDVNGDRLPVSVIPEERLGELRGLIKSNLRIYDAEVCAQRAHVMADQLAAAGIETVKIFVEPGGVWPFKGSLYPDDKAKATNGGSWKFHVAVAFLVKKKDGSVEQYIYDPFLESKPVPRAFWESRLRANPQSSVGSIDLANRYVMLPGSKYDKRTEYDRKELQGAYRVMSGDKKY